MLVSYRKCFARNFDMAKSLIWENGNYNEILYMLYKPYRRNGTTGFFSD